MSCPSRRPNQGQQGRRRGQQAQRAPFKPELAFPELEGVKEDFVPSPKNQPGQDFPMVNSQGYARFRIDIPHADEVTVSLGLGGRGGTKLKKAYDGSFTGQTEGPLDEGFHYYHLTVDRGTVNDPGTLNYYGSTRWESGINESVKALNGAGQKAVGYISPNTGHEFLTWRRSLKELAPLLFK